MIDHFPKRVLQNKRLGIVALILFLGSAYFYQDPEWNGNSRLNLTRAIVESGSFIIDEYVSQPNWATEDKAFYNGHYYSDKAIGGSMLATPIYFFLYKTSTLLGFGLGSVFIKHILTLSVMGTAFTLNGLAMYLVAYQITQKPWLALVPTLAIAFGTMLWPYSAVFYGHVLATAFTTLAFWLVFSSRFSKTSATSRSMFWAGLSVGLAFISDHTTALIITGILVYGTYILRNQWGKRFVRLAIAAMLGALIPLLIMLVYNKMVFGTAFTSGYAYESEDQFSSIMSAGVLNLPNLTNTFRITFGSQFGLFWQSPILLLGLVGILLTLRSPLYRAEGLLCLYSIVAMTAMNGGLRLWWGGSSFGPRYIIPALPFFVVPLASLPRRWIWMTISLGILSTAHMLIPLMGQIQPSKLVYRLHRNTFYINDEPFSGFSLLYDYGIPQIARQYAAGNPAWTLGAALGLPFWLSIPALVAAESALIFEFHRRTKKGDLPRGM